MTSWLLYSYDNAAHALYCYICCYLCLQKNTLLRNKCYILSTPEIKILILTIYFIIFSILVTTNISLIIKYSNNYYERLYGYFYCQLHGDNSACDKLKEEYKQFDYPHLTSITILMIGLVTCVNLIFAIKVQDVKEFCSRVTMQKN